MKTGKVTAIVTATIKGTPLSELKTGFHWRQSRSRSRNQKRRALRSSENQTTEQRSRKQSFLLRLRSRRSRSSENQIVGDVSRSGRTKPITKRGNEHCDWFILLLLLLQLRKGAIVL